MQAYSLMELLARHSEQGQAYFEFLRKPALSVGIYRLPGGGVDPQLPHTEDEVYYVLRGAATIVVGEEERLIATGDTIFVAANVAHRFHSITEALDLLVFFAPCEYAMATRVP